MKSVAMLDNRFDHEYFDGLLDESSLNTAAARKNQAETPVEVHQRVQDHLRDREGACRQGDVDDFLFHLVRLYPVPNDTRLTSSALVNTAFSTRFWMLRHHVRADAVPDIVQALLDKEVFSYLRQDVARSMVSFCLESKISLPPVVLNACASAVPTSSFSDELADAFMNMMPTEPAALPAGSYRAGLRAHKRTSPAPAMTRPGNRVDAQHCHHDRKTEAASLICSCALTNETRHSGMKCCSGTEKPYSRRCGRFDCRRPTRSTRYR